MKKATRTLLITAAALMALGLIIGGIGFALGGGRMQSLNPIEKSREIAEGFTSVDISCSSAGCWILPSADGACRVETGESDVSRFKISVEGGRLSITQHREQQWHFFLLGSEKNYVRLYLPQREYDALNIRSISGGIKCAQGPSFEKAQLGSVSGSIALECAVRDTVLIRSTSGSISAKELECRQVSAISTSGRVSLSSVRCTEVSAESTSGRIELERVLASEVLSAVNTSGSVIFDRCDGGEIHARSVSGSIKGTLNTPKAFYTSSVSGSVRVPNNGDGGKCELSTVSGSIDITLAE